MAPHNDEQCEALAEIVVEAWELDTLIQWAVEQLTEHYKKDREAFETDYKDMVEANQ